MTLLFLVSVLSWMRYLFSFQIFPLMEPQCPLMVAVLLSNCFYKKVFLLTELYLLLSLWRSLLSKTQLSLLSDWGSALSCVISYHLCAQSSNLFQMKIPVFWEVTSLNKYVLWKIIWIQNWFKQSKSRNAAQLWIHNYSVIQFPALSICSWLCHIIYNYFPLTSLIGWQTFSNYIIRISFL